MHSQIGYLSALALLVTGAACGGKVVFDTGGSGAAFGQGGAGAGSGTTTHSGPSGTGGASCENYPDPSELTLCGASNDDTTCMVEFCDAADNKWLAKCTETTCVCQ